MKYDPFKHHRHSIRLQGYDYTQSGAYFVTMCAQNRECLFGEIVDGEMRLNDAGQMVARWWDEVPCKFSSVEMDNFVIMPNHFHGIAVITGIEQGAHTGAPLHDRDAYVGADLRVRPGLGQIMQWFKTMTTNEYIRSVEQNDWRPFAGKLW